MKSFVSGLVLFAGAAALSGCNTDVYANPEGYRCDPGGTCPNGYECHLGVCKEKTNGAGGGAGTGGGVGVGGGAAGGAGGGSGVCAGKVCNQPPGPQCVNAKVRAWAPIGTCSEPVGCEYSFTDTACDTPPTASCKDPSTLTTFANPGLCSAGTCMYAAASIVCLNGCSMNMCQNQDLCAGKICNQPPSATCVAGNVRTFMSPGTCMPGTGDCSYNPIDSACPNGCAAGTCTTAGQTFSQTMPRVNFAVNAIDQAPGSSGMHVVVVGNNGKVLKWDGVAFSPVTSITPTTAAFNSVWFTGSSTAVLAGSQRTVARYTGTSFGVMAGIPGSGSANFIAVHGKDADNFVVIDGSDSYWRYSGAAWTNPSFADPLASYKMAGVWVDGSNRVRIVGSKTTLLTGSTSGVVQYLEGVFTYEDVDDSVDGGIADGFSAVGGPALDGGTVALDMAVLGRSSTNGLRRHKTTGAFDSAFNPALSLPTGGGIKAITAASGSRAIYFLTKPGSFLGHLYRYSGSTGLDPDPLADFYFGKVSMGPTESGGVVVAETSLASGVNNIYRRNAVGGEMLDLGENWAAVTSNGTSLMLVSQWGDLAVRIGASPTWQFRRGPLVLVTDATAANGTGTLVVAKSGSLEKFITGATTPLVTPIATATMSDLNGVCRVSDSEAYAVGSAGVIRSINTSAATATSMTSPTTRNLLAVDCPATGSAVACGQGAIVLRLAGGQWTTVTPSLPVGTADLASCRLVGSTIFVAGDNVFYKMDLSAMSPVWQQLGAQPAMRRLSVVGPNEIYAISGTTRVVRFDGAAWTTRFTLNSGSLVGGGQVGGKVVYAGDLGTVVEGQ